MLDALEDGLLAIEERAQKVDAGVDLANQLLGQPAGAFFAIAGDKGDRVAFVQKLHDAFDLHFANLQVLRDARAFWRGDRLHETIHPRWASLGGKNAVAARQGRDRPSRGQNQSA